MEGKSSYLSFPLFPDNEEDLFTIGFEKDEVLSLLYLRQWYQSGGSDRAEVIRGLEIIKQRVEKSFL